MEVKINKSERSEWRFPCKGICKPSNIIVGFSEYGQGVVLDVGQSEIFKLYTTLNNWDMNVFEPLLKEKQPVDWDKITYPVYAIDMYNSLIKLESACKEKDGLRITVAVISDTISTDDYFKTRDKSKKWVDSLEILPKGTKIEITL